MLITGLFLVLASAGCGADSPSTTAQPAATQRSNTDEGNSAAETRGEALYQQVAYTYPVHTDFDLEHQLVVRSEDPDSVMALLDLQPGMVVADIGCGSGFYTTRFARAVGPSGRVLAMDIQPGTIARLDERLQDGTLNPYDNVTAWVNKVDDAQIDPGTADLAFIAHADFYAFDHLLPENKAFIQSCYQAVKPGGRLVVVQDMRLVPTGSVEAIRRNFQAAGFVSERSVLDPRGSDTIELFRKAAR